MLEVSVEAPRFGRCCIPREGLDYDAENQLDNSRMQRADTEGFLKFCVSSSLPGMGHGEFLLTSRLTKVVE